MGPLRASAGIPVAAPRLSSHFWRGLDQEMLQKMPKCAPRPAQPVASPGCSKAPVAVARVPKQYCRCKGLDSWSKGVDRRSWGLDRWSRCVNGSSCCLDCWSRCLHRQGKGVTAAAGTAVTLGPLHDHHLQRMGGGSTASLGTIGVEMSMPCGPQSALGGAMGITDHGSGGLDHGSGGLDHGSGALAHGSGGLDHGSGGPDHASGALPAHSDTAVLT
eukprot:gene11191-biopygen18380